MKIKARGHRERGILIDCGRSVNWCIHYGYQHGRLLKAWNRTFIQTSYATPGTFPKESASYYRHICSWVLTVSLRTIATKYKQTRCLLPGE